MRDSWSRSNDGNDDIKQHSYTYIHIHTDTLDYQPQEWALILADPQLSSLRHYGDGLNSSSVGAFTCAPDNWSADDIYVVTLI